MPIAVVPSTSVVVGRMVSPSEGVTVVVPAAAIVVGTIVRRGPPPVVTEVNTYTPGRWIRIIPVEVGEIGIVIAPAAVNIRVETTQTRGVIVVVIVVIIVIIGGGNRTVAWRGINRIGVFDDRFANTGIVGFGVN